MADMDSLTSGDSMGRSADLDARAQELKEIREWSHDIERDPFAFGPSIDKQRAIKVLIAALDEAEAKSGDEVSKALEELREMFPGSVCGIKAERGNQSFDYVLVSARSGELQTPHSVSAKTLEAAMAKVRDDQQDQVDEEQNLGVPSGKVCKDNSLKVEPAYCDNCIPVKQWTTAALPYTNIRLCSLHAAAPKLYAALKTIISAMPNPPDAPVGPEDEWSVRPEAIKTMTMGDIRRARKALSL